MTETATATPLAQEGEERVAVPVETLTDEELSVLVAPGGSVMLPYLNDLSEDHTEVARRSGYRSLLARGIVDPPTPEVLAQARRESSDEVELMVRDDVRSVIALREGATVMVAVARTTSQHQDFWYAHVVEDIVVLEEVSSDGLHRFALADADRLPDLVVAAAVHPEAADSAGDPVPLQLSSDGVATAPDSLTERLGETHLRSDVVIRHWRDQAPPLHGVLSGPQGTYVTLAQEGRPLETRPVAASEAAAALREVVAEATARGRRG